MKFVIKIFLIGLIFCLLHGCDQSNPPLKLTLVIEGESEPSFRLIAANADSLKLVAFTTNGNVGQRIFYDDKLVGIIKCSKEDGIWYLISDVNLPVSVHPEGAIWQLFSTDRPEFVKQISGKKVFKIVRGECFGVSPK